TIENTFIDTFLYFDNNVVNGNLRFGKRVLAQEDKVIKFSKAVSIADNKIRNGMFYNLVFELTVCLHSNNFDGDLTSHDTVYKKAMDFTGSFVGGSFIFKKTEAENYDGDLILDNIFIDKRIAFYNSFPYTFSYKNATFNGFEIPQNWKMHKKKLINTFYRDQDAIKFKKISNFTELKRWLIRVIYGGRKLYIFRENNLRKTQHEDADLPYNLIKSQYEADPYLNKLPALWKEIQFEIIPDEKKKKILTEVIEHGENIITGSNYFNECINKSFLPVYYGFYNKDVLEALSGLTEHFLEAENNSEDEEVSQIFNLLKEFCKRFHYTLWYFNNHKVLWGAGEVKKDQQLFKKKLNESLEEQYRVLRQIYRNEGELTNEDWAYYKWMHYKNLAEANSASFKQKLKSWGKYLIFEKTFGWGVDLLVILRSTGWIILLFAAIYNVMFLINPELSIQWDEQTYTPDFILSCVLALQTTFSAVLGDWAPIGSGSIKIPMTINAVMGVFFVTFMIGAYGRKMLR
ncbi:MAG: hypothetical protein KAR09_09430, partial [Bacteroidales bacterium]|nr:hypothetical protein [Bacteroidales bacterium]